MDCKWYLFSDLLTPLKHWTPVYHLIWNTNNFVYMNKIWTNFHRELLIDIKFCALFVMRAVSHCWGSTGISSAYRILYGCRNGWQISMWPVEHAWTLTGLHVMLTYRPALFKSCWHISQWLWIIFFMSDLLRLVIDFKGLPKNI